MSRTLRIRLSGDPSPCPRPRARRQGKHARVYYPKGYEEQKTRWRWEAITQTNGAAFPKGTRLSVWLTIDRATRRIADGDNLAKAVTDALNQVAYHDDAQIDRWHITVRRGVGRDRAGTRVVVARLGTPRLPTFHRPGQIRARDFREGVRP